MGFKGVSIVETCFRDVIRVLGCVGSAESSLGEHAILGEMLFPSCYVNENTMILSLMIKQAVRS